MSLLYLQGWTHSRTKSNVVENLLAKFFPLIIFLNFVSFGLIYTADTVCLHGRSQLISLSWNLQTGTWLDLEFWITKLYINLSTAVFFFLDVALVTGVPFDLLLSWLKNDLPRNKNFSRQPIFWYTKSQTECTRACVSAVSDNPQVISFSFPFDWRHYFLFNYKIIFAHRRRRYFRHKNCSPVFLTCVPFLSNILLLCLKGLWRNKNSLENRSQ